MSICNYTGDQAYNISSGGPARAVFGWIKRKIRVGGNSDSIKL